MNKCIVAVSGHKGNFQRAVEKFYEDEQYKIKVADCGEMLPCGGCLYCWYFC